MKPIARSQGKGIFLFNKLQQIQQWKSEYRWKPENAAVSRAEPSGVESGWASTPSSSCSACASVVQRVRYSHWRRRCCSCACCGLAGWLACCVLQVEAYVVQQYLSSPYLIGGKKFDLRVYALVTSYAPLTVWIYRTGFTRFSASRYSSDPADIANAFMHLTNVAVQKTSTEYNVEMGGKWEIGKLKQYIACK